jgi:hypothetical protein
VTRGNIKSTTQSSRAEKAARKVHKEEAHTTKKAAGEARAAEKVLGFLTAATNGSTRGRG